MNKRNAKAVEIQYVRGDTLPREPGYVWFGEYLGDPRGLMSFCCPCGCARIGAVRLVGEHRWELVAPMPGITLTPSIDFNRGHWHGHLIGGEFQEC